MSLRNWHHEKKWWRVIKSTIKVKNFILLRVVYHAVRVLWVGKHFIQWRQTFLEVQAWRILSCQNIGGARYLRSFAIARDGLLVCAAELCYFHHCLSHLLSHGCRVNYEQALRNPEFIVTCYLISGTACDSHKDWKINEYRKLKLHVVFVVIHR